MMPVTEGPTTKIPADPVVISRVNEILNRIRAGETLYLCTMTRATKITPKTLASFEASGIELIRARRNEIKFREGKSYVTAAILGAETGWINLVGFRFES